MTQVDQLNELFTAVLAHEIDQVVSQSGHVSGEIIPSWTDYDEQTNIFYSCCGKQYPASFCV